jgi:hypothetical protein
MRRSGTLTTIVLGFFFSISLAASSLTVAFNQKTYKYHYLSCTWAHKCTVNCIDISLAEAISRGGIPCKKCHPPATMGED